MEFILLYLLFASAVYAVSCYFFRHTITLKEVAIGVLIQAVVSACLFYGSIYAGGHDKQILNGYVTSKIKDRVSCEHSYPCNCRTVCSGSGSSQSCSTSCDTCYRHTHDYDWVVKSNVGYVIIDRIDSQGVKTPPRWNAVEVGEFFAQESSYFNYIKASPMTIFDKNLINSETVVPPYISVYDYYRINRVQDYQSQYKGDFNRLNDLLNESLKTLGDKKKVNIVVMFHRFDETFVETVKAKQYGGKFNDVFVMINADIEGTYRRVDVFSWSKDNLVSIKIRDELLDNGKVDMDNITSVITKNIDKHFVKRSAEEFKYLEESFEPPFWVLVLMAVFGLVFPFVWSYYAHKHLY